METRLRSRYHRIISFKYAFEGIAAALKSEPNLKFHMLFAVAVVTAGFYLEISRLEWAIVMAMVGLVITLELTNTAIEVIVDSFTTEQHPGAKLSKDISAGAVLIASVTAAVIGLIIFLPHLR